MSDVEKIRILGDISAYLDQSEIDSLVLKLGIDPKNLDARLKGFQIEDEFLMIVNYLECAKHIVSCNESAAVLTGSYQADFVVQLKSGETFFVEVKSKEDFKYKISGGNLDKRVQFAKDFGLPLFFAVKLGKYWVFVDSGYLKSKNGKLELAADFENSLFSVKFDSKAYVFPSGIRVVSEYSKSKPGTGISFPPYGELISYRFFFKDDLIFEFNQQQQANLGISMYLEILHDQMANTNMKIEQVDDDFTRIIESLDSDFIFHDYEAFLSSLHHTNSDGHGLYNSSLLFKSILESKGNSRFIDKNVLAHIIERLAALGLPIIETKMIPKHLFDE